MLKVFTVICFSVFSLFQTSFLYAFDFYDAGKCERQNYLNNSDIRSAIVIYEKHFWRGAESRLSYPGDDRFAAAIQNVKADFVVVDIESWEEGRWSQDAVQKYLQALSVMKRVRPALKVGFYGVVPKRNYFGAIKSVDGNEHRRWLASNDVGQKIADSVDILFPSLYTFYPDEDRWMLFAQRQVQEAKRLAPHKPVIAFIWPRYHESNYLLGGRYIGKHFLYHQLDVLSKIADGVIVWDKADDCKLSDVWRRDFYDYVVCKKSSLNGFCK